MTINWKQGLFAAVTLLSLTLFVGCDKTKSDKAVADKTGDKTAEVVEEVDVIEIAPVKPDGKSDSKTENAAPAPAPALTAPETPAPAPAPAPTETPAPSAPTSTITSSEMSSSTAEESIESESVFGHRRRGCVTVSVCSPCAPAPVCAECVPACEPACAPSCDSCCSPCRVTCKERRMARRAARACWNPCAPICAPACAPCAAACEPACAPADCANGDCSGSWSTETENAEPAAVPTPSEDNKQVNLPVPRATSEIHSATPSAVIGTEAGKPEAPAIALPDAK